jgi:phage terminase large subunit-like protein
MVVVGKVAGEWQTVPHFWTPEKGMEDRAKRDRAPYDVWHRHGYLHSTPGATIDYEFVATDMAAILSGLNVQAVAFDRWRIDLLQKELDKIGCDLPLVPHGQGFKDMSVSLDALESELLNTRVAHGGHPVLAMCAANAIVVKDPSGGRKLDKSKATGRIDGLQAMAMAFGAAAQATEEQEIYSGGAFAFV